MRKLSREGKERFNRKVLAVSDGKPVGKPPFSPSIDLTGVEVVAR